MCVCNYSSVVLVHNYGATDRDFIVASLSPRKRFAYLSRQSGVVFYLSMMKIDDLSTRARLNSNVSNAKRHRGSDIAKDATHPKTTMRKLVKHPTMHKRNKIHIFRISVRYHRAISHTLWINMCFLIVRYANGPFDLFNLIFGRRTNIAQIGKPRIVKCTAY